MTHNVVYRYLGINGVVQTPVFIEGANGLKVNVLIADASKMLTDGKQQKHQVFVSDQDVDKWKEIDA